MDGFLFVSLKKKKLKVALVIYTISFAVSFPTKILISEVNADDLHYKFTFFLPIKNILYLTFIYLKKEEVRACVRTCVRP